jgi:hypothetical protein
MINSFEVVKAPCGAVLCELGLVFENPVSGEFNALVLTHKALHSVAKVIEDRVKKSPRLSVVYSVAVKVHCELVIYGTDYFYRFFVPFVREHRKFNFSHD